MQSTLKSFDYSPSSAVNLDRSAERNNISEYTSTQNDNIVNTMPML